jgi:hypothetical protein
MSGVTVGPRRGNPRTSAINSSSSKTTPHNSRLHINPHIHFLVPAGGIAPDGESWIAFRPGFFLPVTVLSAMFRGLFLRYLTKAFAAGALNFFSAYTTTSMNPRRSGAIWRRFGKPNG